jgi:hypothetical protein
MRGLAPASQPVDITSARGWMGSGWRIVRIISASTTVAGETGGASGLSGPKSATCCKQLAEIGAMTVFLTLSSEAAFAPLRQ